MSRFQGLSTNERMPFRSSFPKKRGPTDSHLAFLNLIPSKTATPPPTHRVSCDTPLKFNPNDLRQALPSLKGPSYRRGSLSLSIFEDSIFPPPIYVLPPLTKGRVEDVKLEMLVHLNNSEYAYASQIVTWALPLANTLDLNGIYPNDFERMVPLLQGFAANCHWFQEYFLTEPSKRLEEARKTRVRKQVEEIQSEILWTCMKADKHLTYALSLLTTLAERVELAKTNGIWVDLPSPALEVPECAAAVAGFVSAKGWGICFQEKTDEYWALRERVWGMITKFHLGYDLIKENPVEQGNFAPWIDAMITAVQDKLPRQDIRAWRKQEQDDLYDYFVSPLEP